MKSTQRVTIAQTQRLQLTLGLATSIRVLAQDAAGLTRFLEEQAAENPYLALETVAPAPTDWLPRWQEAWRGLRGDGTAADHQAAAGPSLMAHVLAEVERLIPAGDGRRIAIALAEALEPSGWLGQPLPLLCKALGVPLAAGEAVLARLQTMEPTGLFARSLAECLRLQAAEGGLLDPPMAVLLDHLELVARGDLARLARLAGTDEEAIALRLRRLRGFDPKPGASFGPGAAPVREPDLVVTRGPEGWSVSLNRSALPTLLVKRPERRPATEVEREVWSQARAVGRLLESRNATLLRVGREILARQQAALEQGALAVQPMTMSEVATALDLHESTVSRVVAGTSVDMPGGTLWLRSLFTGQVGAGPSAAALRARLAQLIAAEDAAHPLSDAALAEALAAEGKPVARRTLAKYREMLHIPPAHRRRRKG